MGSGIDLLRHVLSLAVILQHMPSATRYSPQTQQQLAAAVDWVDGAVLGFFMISGFLYRRPASLGPWIGRQARKLLLPFLLFSTIYALLMAGLGKAPLAQGLVQTVTLQGAGMQLYFLPWLLAVSAAFAAADAAAALPPRRFALAASAVALALAWMLPGTASTGPDPRLLPLYLLAFAIGAVLRPAFDQGRTLAWALPILAGALVLGRYDARWLDLAFAAGGLAAALLAAPHLPGGRWPGSGGVYLLHTPVVNFALSALLQKAGVVQGANVAASVLLTYGLCLGATLLLIRWQPRTRPWLLE